MSYSGAYQSSSFSSGGNPSAPPPPYNPHANVPPEISSAYEGYGSGAGGSSSKPHTSGPPQYAQPKRTTGYGPSSDKTLHQNDEAEIDGHRFGVGECRDWIWAVLFLMHLGVVIGAGALYFSRYRDEMTSSSSTSSEDPVHIEPSAFILLGLFFVTNIICAWLLLKAIEYYARQMVWFCLIFSVAWLAGLGLLLLFMGQVLSAVIFLVLAGVNAYYVYAVRSRIDFSAVILEIVSIVVRQYSSTIFVGVFSVVVQSAWLVLWVLSAASVMHALNLNNSSDDAKNWVYFLYLVSLYWTGQVIQNVVHVTVAGLLATWYFLFPHSMPKNPTWASFKRASWSSFGSICFGSLLVAVVKAVRAVVQQGRDSRNQWIRCIAVCLLNCIDQLLTFFNTYAYAQIAIYGKSYLDAAQDTWTLLKSRGIDVIINDDLSGTVLTFAALIGGLTSAAVGAIFANFVFGIEFWGVWALIGGLIGFVLTMCVMEVMYSAVCALYVCWAEAPAVLAETKPEVFHKFMDALHVYHSHHYNPPAFGNQV